MPAQDLNKCDNQSHLNEVPGSNTAQATIMYSSNKADLNNASAGTPVISINYNQQQQNAFTSSMAGNSPANVQANLYSSGQSVACTQTSYVNTNTMNPTLGNENSYAIQQQQINGKKSSCDNTAFNLNSNAGNQFNRNLINQNAQATNRNQLPTLAFQSSSQSNLNQLNDQTTTFGNSLNSNHPDHQPNHHHHSSAIHVNTALNHNSNNNFLYANTAFSTAQTTGSLPDLSLFNHQTVPLCVPLDPEDALSSGLNSNDNSNNSNQSALSSSSFQFSGVTSSSVPCGSMNNYRANQSNFIQYNCSNPNSSNSNSPLHQNASFSNLTAGQQAAMGNSQPMNVGHNNSGINFNNSKLHDNSKFINQQITNNQLATQFHNHHISSPVRPSSVESTEDSGVIFNQLTGNVSWRHFSLFYPFIHVY